MGKDAQGLVLFNEFSHSLCIRMSACALFLLFPQETLCWVFSVCLRISGRVGEK